MEERKKRRWIGTSEPNTGSIAQVMPKSRVRLDPTIIRDLSCWILAMYAHQRRAAAWSWGRNDDESEKQKRSYILRMRETVKCVSDLLNRLRDTCDLAEFSRLREEWDKGRIANETPSLFDTDDSGCVAHDQEKV